MKNRTEQNRTEQNRTEQNHYCLLTNNSNFYISQIFKTFEFLSVFFRFAKTLSLRGFEKSEVIHSIYNFFKNWIATPLLRSARNDNYFYSSLRGIGNAEVIYSIVDCFITFAHAVRLTLCALATAMTIKNNLVKTFLTSITFDSLSRKIKNPCLVIKKKFIPKGDF